MRAAPRSWVAAALTVLAVLAALLLGGCDGGGDYHRKAGRWHFDDRPMDVADPRSFQPLSRHFARDRVQGYYRDVPVRGSDGASFEALSAHEARDRQRVYWADTYRKGQEYWSIAHRSVTVLEGADPARYRPLRHGYGSDGQRVWFEGRAFAVRDAASFEVLDREFSRDAQRGYFRRREIEGSDGASFALFDPGDGSHVRDRRNVWHARMELPDDGGPPVPVVTLLKGADPAKVELLGGSYARDDRRVWWRGRPVAGADAASFETGSSVDPAGDAQDRQWHYREGRRAGRREGPGSAATATSAPR